MSEDAELNNVAANEIASEQRMENERLRSDALLMDQLMRHPAWKRYITMIEGISQNFVQTALTPLENFLEMPKAEAAKGTLKGLSLAAQLPAAKIREAKDRLGGAFMDAEE